MKTVFNAYKEPSSRLWKLKWNKKSPQIAGIRPLTRPAIRLVSKHDANALNILAHFQLQCAQRGKVRFKAGGFKTSQRPLFKVLRHLPLLGHNLKGSFGDQQFWG